MAWSNIWEGHILAAYNIWPPYFMCMSSMSMFGRQQRYMEMVFQMWVTGEGLTKCLAK